MKDFRSTQSPKLFHLIHALWNSPVFNDSFPTTNKTESTLAQFDAIYPLFVKTIHPILKQGLPDSDENELGSIIGQIAPKSIAFCASISAGEIQNVEHLAYAAVAISLSYWADQGMDRGDEWMLRAVQYLNHKSVSGKFLASNKFQTRLEALRHIQHLTSRISLPDDLPYVQQAIERDVLGNQAEMRVLSHQFKTYCDDFWHMRSEEVTQTMIDCSGLMSAVSIIYAIYRHRQPELPSLDKIYAHPTLMQLVRNTFNPAVRVFDDAGDCYTDMGEDLHWGEFNINIFNQAHPTLLKKFLEYSEIQEDHPLHAEVLSAFALPIAESRTRVSALYLNLVRERVLAIPNSLWKDYDVFLTLCKRTLEAGFVNIIGDVLLTENTRFTTSDLDLLKLVMPDSSIHLFRQEIVQ